MQQNGWLQNWVPLQVSSRVSFRVSEISVPETQQDWDELHGTGGGWREGGERGGRGIETMERRGGREIETMERRGGRKEKDRGGKQMQGKGTNSFRGVNNNPDSDSVANKQQA